MITPTRKPLRLPRYDYREVGWYFVTICTADRRHLFGEIDGGQFRGTELGDLVAACWREIPDHFPHVVIDAWVVMPNHLHGLIEIRDRASAAAAGNAVAAGALGTVVRSFKAAVTRRFRERHPAATAPVWQRRYYEHVLRGLKSIEYVRAYIRSNPERWHLDAENGRRSGRDPFERWLESQGKNGAQPSPRLA